MNGTIQLELVQIIMAQITAGSEEVTDQRKINGE